jgi:hypothetical protein
MAMLKAMSVSTKRHRDGTSNARITLDTKNAIALAAYLLQQALKPGTAVNLVSWRSGNMSVLRPKKGRT